MSPYVTCHVTAISHASSSSMKEKEIQKKRNIKSRKIDKRKMLAFKVFHNTKKQTIATLKDCNTSATIDLLVAAFKKLLEK